MAPTSAISGNTAFAAQAASSDVENLVDVEAPETEAAAPQPAAVEDGFDGQSSGPRYTFQNTNSAIPGALLHTGAAVATGLGGLTFKFSDAALSASTLPTESLKGLRGAELAGGVARTVTRALPGAMAGIDNVIAFKDVFDDAASGGKKWASVGTATLSSIAAAAGPGARLASIGEGAATAAKFLPGAGKIIGTAAALGALGLGILRDKLDD